MVRLWLWLLHLVNTTLFCMLLCGLPTDINGSDSLGNFEEVPLLKVGCCCVPEGASVKASKGPGRLYTSTEILLPKHTGMWALDIKAPPELPVLLHPSIPSEIILAGPNRYPSPLKGAFSCCQATGLSLG